MRLILAALLLAPVVAAAQSSLVMTPTGTQNGQSALSMGDVARSGQTKLDLGGDTSAQPVTPANGGIATRLDQLFTGQLAAQVEAIVNPVVSPTYLGGTSIPQPNLHRLTNGHLQILGQPGQWGSQTNVLTVEANEQYQNNGNQGNFWDPTYRLAYGGQDQGAMYISIQARTPELSSAAVSSFGTATIATPAGNRTVYTAVLTTPMTVAQMADLGTRPPNTRVEISNGFFAYLIPPGYLSPSGASVPPVSTDGTTLIVDNWVCDACSPQVASSANAQPSSVGSAPYTLSLDVTHQIDDIYGGASVSDADQVTDVNGDERTFANFKSSPEVLNLSDPLSSTQQNGKGLRIFSHYGGVIGGYGTAYMMAGGGWDAASVARNPQQSGSQGSTYGFLVPSQSPSWGFYSTQSGGYVLGVDPGNSCQITNGAACTRTVLLDTAGNLTLAGNVTANGTATNAGAQVNGSISFRNAAGTAQSAYIDGIDGTIGTNGSITSLGTVTDQGEQVNGATSFRSADGLTQNAYVQGSDGTIGTNGNVTAAGYVTPGSFAFSNLPGCGTSQLGAHLYVTDGRKPGEIAGGGSGVPADCTPPVKGASPGWVSVYDHRAVVN